jgi:hypothetical protein
VAESFSQCFLAFSNVSSAFSMFHGFFHCLAAGNNEKSRQTLFAAVEHCFSGFSIVSAGGEAFQAAASRIRPSPAPPPLTCA